MTPAQTILHEEIFLKERIKKDIQEIIQKQVDHFVNQTGVKLQRIEFVFMDMSTIEKPISRFHRISINYVIPRINVDSL
jgi:hypothetical protein